LEITMVNADRKLESHWEFANQRLSLISNRYNVWGQNFPLVFIRDWCIAVIIKKMDTCC